MMTSLPPSSPSVGRFTGFVLGLVVFVCVFLIGCAGYLKYQLDRAETVLTMPESGDIQDEDVTGKLRRSLGYGGFLGFAQNYVASHDSGALSNMRAQIKIADDLISQLPEKTSAEARHDLQSIVSMFDDVMQKANKAASDSTTFFTTNDLLPLYGTLPVLDARLSSAATSNKTEAHNQLQFWAMLLTLISWSSLIIAAAMSVGIYLSLRDRNSAPLRALAQSIRNMASGDMRTSIWGMERSDMVGELARAVDLARYTFSQLPDLSVLSEQGPLRLRFEGKTGSMFEAIMQVITHDSEQVRNHTTGLADAITRQNEAITLISSRVEAVLHNVEKRGLDGDHQIKHVVHTLVSSAQSLKNAQEHSTDQLNRIIPFLQDRAQGMAEIAQITGKQISQVLQNLTLTERGLKSSAEQSDLAIKKLSTTADDLGGRLFGAVNLLQASGKVLSETTEKTQNRLNEAIAKLEHSINFTVTPDFPATGDNDGSPDSVILISRLESAVQTFEEAQQRLDERILQQNQATQAHIDLLSTQSLSLLSQTTTTAQTLSSAADNMRDERSRFDQVIENVAIKLEALSTRLQEQSSTGPSLNDGLADLISRELRDVTQHIESVASQISTLSEASRLPELVESLSEKILGKIDIGFGSTQNDIEQAKNDLLQLLQSTRTEIYAIQKADTASKLTSFSDKLLNKISDGFSTTSEILHVLQNQLVEFAQKIDFSSQNNFSATLSHNLDVTTQLVRQTHADITSLSKLVSGLENKPSTELAQDVQKSWYQMAAQIEATRADLMQAITQQVDRIESRIQGSSAHPEEASIESADTQKQIEQQTLILTELVATLGVLDTHMQQLKTEVRAVRH